MTTTLERLRRGELAGAETLDLSGQGLTEFPREILDLADTLTRLDLGRNKRVELPHDFARLGRLKILFASKTPYDTLPEILGDCPALTQIGFRDCGIADLPAAALPPRLEWLTLTGNRIAFLPGTVFDRPIRKLMLAGNRLASLPENLAGADTLELLRLSANRLETLPPCLASLPRLAWLAFAANPSLTTARSRTAPPPRIAWSALELGAEIGEGASGRIHAATLEGRPVAVKLFKSTLTSDGPAEAEIEASLALPPHPGLLAAHARITGHPDATDGLVLPLLPADMEPLASPPSLSTCTRDVYDPALALPPDAARTILRTIAQAGAHLASNRMLHGDLYAHNIHWNRMSSRAILSDLGAATPEAEAYEPLDILAWGILAGELLERCTEPDPTLAVLQRAATLPVPADRPAFADLLDTLRG